MKCITKNVYQKLRVLWTFHIIKDKRTNTTHHLTALKETRMPMSYPPSLPRVNTGKSPHRQKWIKGSPETKGQRRENSNSIKALKMHLRAEKCMALFYFGRQFPATLRENEREREAVRGREGPQRPHRLVEIWARRVKERPLQGRAVFPALAEHSPLPLVGKCLGNSEAIGIFVLILKLKIWLTEKFNYAFVSLMHIKNHEVKLHIYT